MADTYADLVDAMRRNRISTAKSDWTPLSRDQLEALGTNYYDLGGMFCDGHDEQVTPDVWKDYVRETDERGWGNDLVENSDPFAIGFLWKLETRRIVRVIVPQAVGAMLAVNKGLNPTIQMYASMRGQWFCVASDAELNQVVGIASLMARDAELNVEFVEREPRLDAVNRGRAIANLSAIGRTRVISLSTLRKQFLGGVRAPHQGGTHARPVEHIRVLTKKVITPKGRQPYTRNAKVITINAGVRRETKVVL